MLKELAEYEWEEILEKFKIRDCSVKNFCEKHEVSKNEIYKRLKSHNIDNDIKFHAIEVKEDEKKIEEIEIIKDNSSNENKEIKIEIGKGVMYIGKNNIELLKLVMEELIKSC